ncbi:MAG: acyl carrier protein [Proteobacteria bacterium]|nr:MAG: acyl carrier protein [Pseudomonadota bacterium]
MKQILTSPFDIVAKVLQVNVDEINEHSAKGETPNWDSLNHVILIGELENNYGIQIPNDDIEKYEKMKAIILLYLGICRDRR